MTERSVRPLVLLSSLATGGAERVTVSFVRRLRALGVDASVATLTARFDGPLAAELSDNGVPRHDLGARRLADLRSLVRLRRLLARERPDVVHAHGQDAAILAAALRRVHAFPLVITRHVIEEPRATLRQRLRARAACGAFRRADAVVAVSRAAARRLAELCAMAYRSIQVIPNGIELERFDGSACRPELRPALSAGPEDRLVLVPAVLREGKGHETLLAALPELKARVPSVRVVFAGGGEREAALRAQAHGLGDAISFLGPRTDIPDLLAACDLVVLPSVSEALPTALIEAAASGRPVVATRTGGIPEIVVDGVTGLLVPPSDPRALAEAVATLLLDGARARAYGAAASQLARRRFSIATLVTRTLGLWNALLDGWPRRAPVAGVHPIATTGNVPMNREDRLRTELAFQADRASRMRRVLPTPGHLVERYRAPKSWRLFPVDYLFAQLSDLPGREVLDFGCGDGALSVIMARLGAHVTAVDISPELIAVARKRAAADGVDDRIQFVQRDITAGPAWTNRYDYAVCNLVLHHVDVRSVVPVIVAALKPRGTAIFVEPIALSPWLAHVRDLVPIDKRASPGERPLNEDEVEFVLNELADPERTYFNLLGRLRRLLPNRHETRRGYPLTRACLFLLYGVDRVLLTAFPVLQRFCGSIAIVGQKPVAVPDAAVGERRRDAPSHARVMVAARRDAPVPVGGGA